MDGNRYAFYMELVKSLIGLFIIYYYGDWFFSSQHWPWYHYVVAGYFIISCFCHSLFCFL
jgi:hypothetical protein